MRNMVHLSTLLIIMIILMGNYQLMMCNGSIAVCLTNCVQCKQMFGAYFQGRVCGDACIATDGKIALDCNNPRTLGSFLKRLY